MDERSTVALRTSAGWWVAALVVPIGAGGMLPMFIIWNGRLWQQTAHVTPPTGSRAVYTEEYAWTAPEAR